jgi:phosphatidylserine decarboxylase
MSATQAPMLGDMIGPPVGPLGHVTIGAIAARALATELTRRHGPKTGLVVGADPDSAVLDAAIDALLPDDSLAVIAPDPAAMREHLAGRGSWIGERVQVVDSPSDVSGVDVVIVGEPVIGTAEQARATVEALAKTLAAGGVLTAATVAVPGIAPAAAAELDRQSALYGVGTDLVLRNIPPLRVHRLCWTPGAISDAETLVPVARPSSVSLTRGMHLDSNGVAAASIALGLAALTKLTRRRSKLWLLPAAAALPVAAFFRDPHREAPTDTAQVLAASDGKVLSVERVSDDRFSGDGTTVEYLRVAAFLSVLDVHVNRAPVAGRVVDFFLTDGGYAAAMTPEAEHNVAAYTVLETARGRVVVVQRTGLVARRIVQRAPVGAVLARGERFGLIRFGSRTDVYLPADAVEPLVTAGDRVVGGATPIARWQ